MSHVTNILLSWSSVEDEADRLREVNAWLEARGHRAFSPTWDDMDATGGDRAVEHPTVLGGFNYLNVRGLWQFLWTLGWVDPDSVQLLVCEQEAHSWSKFPRPEPDAMALEEIIEEIADHGRCPNGVQIRQWTEAGETGGIKSRWRFEIEGRKARGVRAFDAMTIREAAEQALAWWRAEGSRLSIHDGETLD